MFSRLQKREPAPRKSGTRWLFMKAHFDSYDISISAYFRPSRFFMTFGPSNEFGRTTKTAVSEEMASCGSIKNTRTVLIG